MVRGHGALMVPASELQQQRGRLLQQYGRRLQQGRQKWLSIYGELASTPHPISESEDDRQELPALRRGARDRRLGRSGSTGPPAQDVPAFDVRRQFLRRRSDRAPHVLYAIWKPQPHRLQVGEWCDSREFCVHKSKMFVSA